MSSVTRARGNLDLTGGWHRRRQGTLRPLQNRGHHAHELFSAQIGCVPPVVFSPVCQRADIVTLPSWTHERCSAVGHGPIPTTESEIKKHWATQLRSAEPRRNGKHKSCGSEGRPGALCERSREQGDHTASSLTIWSHGMLGEYARSWKCARASSCILQCAIPL